MTTASYTLTANGQVLLYKSQARDKHGRYYFIQGLIKEDSPQDEPLITEIFGYRWNPQDPSDGGSNVDNYYLPLSGRGYALEVFNGRPLTLIAAQKYTDFIVEHYNFS